MCKDLTDMYDSGKAASTFHVEVRKLAGRWLGDVDRRLVVHPRDRERFLKPRRSEGFRNRRSCPPFGSALSMFSAAASRPTCLAPTVDGKEEVDCKHGGEALANREWIACDEFTAADILLAGVLRTIRKTDLMEPFPHLTAYFARCQARPAWQRTLVLCAQRLGVSVDDIR